MSTKGKANIIDIAIGRRLYEIRTKRRMSQEELGQRIGVTFQQIQKYERGANRLSASRLFMAAYVLDVDISCFFTDSEGKDVIGMDLRQSASKDGRDILDAFQKTEK